MLVIDEEIIQNIKGFGYIIPSPRVIHPSYYKLIDGTILSALVTVNYVLPDVRQSGGYSVNTTNLTLSFVPKEKRKPELFVPYDPASLADNVLDEDVEFDVLSENFSTYDLSNNMTLGLKTVVGQVKKTRFYTKEGEPVYIVSLNPVIKIK